METTPETLPSRTTVDRTYRLRVETLRRLEQLAAEDFTGNKTAALAAAIDAAWQRRFGEGAPS